jgi:signal transduction histidine kinase
MVTGLVVDGKGRLWISTNHGGIGRVDEPPTGPPRVRRYSTEDGLTSNNVRALVEDRYGRIFVGSVRGVDRLDPDSGRIRHYGVHDGLVGDFVTAAFRDSCGDLWFGTYGGVSRLEPDREEEEDQPPIAITGLRVAGESYPVLELGEQFIEQVVLEADQRDVAIEFVSVSGQQVQGISYQYSIDTANRSWSRPTKERSVNFARLSPGDYLFAVRAVTAGGKVSKVPATVAFTIRPPLWQRWWVVSLALATVAASLLGLYRYRVRKLLEMERLRMSIASDLHDDIATNLSSIAMFSTLVQNGLGEPSPFLHRITILATESVEAIREIIWSIDPRPETVADLLVRLRDAMLTTCRARGIHLAISVPTQGMDENLTPEQRKNLWLMLKEAVSNAVKHSGGSEIEVTAAPAGKRVRISVRDNGAGCSPSTQSPGRGLETMRRRAEFLGGISRVTSVPGEGTTVEFLIALTR